METALLIGGILLGLIAVAIIVIALLARFKPAALAPLGNLFMKSKRGRDFAQDRIASEIAANPELLDEMMPEEMPRAAREQLEAVLANRSEAERAEVMKRLMEAAESGKMPDVSLLQPKRAVTPGQTRSKNQAKNKRRAANKRARQQRKKR